MLRDCSFPGETEAGTPVTLEQASEGAQLPTMVTSGIQSPGIGAKAPYAIHGRVRVPLAQQKKTHSSKSDSLRLDQLTWAHAMSLKRAVWMFLLELEPVKPSEGGGSWIG